MRETRSALVSTAGIGGPALEPTVFLAAAVGEVVAELRDEPPAGLTQGTAYDAAGRLLELCLAGVH